MKRMVRLTAVVLAAIAVMFCAGVTTFADKLRTVDGVMYKCSDSGEQIGKYSGWAKTSKGRRYYKNGVLCKNKWLKFKSGKWFYFDENGYMATGWTHIGSEWYYIPAVPNVPCFSESSFQKIHWRTVNIPSVYQAVLFR